MLCFLIMLLSAPHGYSQSKAKESSRKEACNPTLATLEISADQMTYENATQTFVFENNVRIQHCKMSLTCTSLRVIRATAHNTLKQVVARGNVHIMHETYQATAEQAQYFELEQKLVLSGRPRATDTTTQNTLTGEEIWLFLQEGKMLATKAHMTFQPQTFNAGSRNAP